MRGRPATLPRRTVGEWTFVAKRTYENPFTDVTVDMDVTDPGGGTATVPGFFDGDGTWRVRFNPRVAGRWTYRVRSHPHDPGLAGAGAFDVIPREDRGFLVATPGQAWGFRYESGEPVFVLGDTAYNLAAETAVGNDIDPYLRRRAGQGFNLVRMLAAPTPFCPPNARAHWSGRRIWPWGGDESAPLFDEFDLTYFRSLDQTIGRIDAAGLGVELIMQMPVPARHYARRDTFTAEWEELWLRHLVARYDAYSCVYFWTLANEYEYITGEYRHTPVSDRWAMRVARLVRRLGQHGHIIAVHNGPELPPFAWRFRADPDAIDAVLYQTWGTFWGEDAWLAAGIEDRVAQALAGWPGSAVLAEYGYETAPELADTMPGHADCDVNHTRRGAWRGAFSGLGIIAGFHQQWWGFGDYSIDQPGVAAVLQLRRFLTEVMPFDRLRPAPELVLDPPVPQPTQLAGVGSSQRLQGHRPLALSDPDRRTVAAYLPVGGSVTLDVAPDGLEARWYDPRTGALTDTVVEDHGGRLRVTSPGGTELNHPLDWALTVTRPGEGWQHTLPINVDR